MTPSRLLTRFSQRLFTEPEQQAEFVAALTQPQSYGGCILWMQDRPATNPFEVLSPLTWQPALCDRIAPSSKPGQHLLHQQGHYYCLDFSSVFAASVLLSVPPTPKRVLDVCAAPGGKSLFAWKMLQPDLLISNEVISKRIGMLISNLQRCQVRSTAVTNLDPQVLAEQIPQTADVVIVDAPCSGQSLLAKGVKAPGCFHPVTINQNANRQKRILANAAQLVAPQGYLAYMTCAFSPEENEHVCDWLLTKFPQFQPLPVPHLAAYQSHISSRPCYRMFPQAGLGAGAFTVLLQNQSTSSPGEFSHDWLEQPGCRWRSSNL